MVHLCRLSDILGYKNGIEDLPEDDSLPALMKKCQKILILSLAFKNNIFINKC